MSRRRVLWFFALVMLALAPAARADGPQGAALQSGIGVVSAGGDLRYLAVGVGDFTVVEVLQTKGARLQKWTAYPGSWGIPSVTANGTGGGLSPDGKTLVLGNTSGGSPSSFRVLDTRTLRQRNHVRLNGSFAFDALSPDGSRLYLIQHTSLDDLSHYIVRSYDLRTNSLQPGRIADRTQQGWVMSGYPVTRTTSADGGWVYTLYQKPGGYPFIHALDTVRGVAHCIGLPWAGDQRPLWNIRLALAANGETLAVRWKSGKPWLTVNTSDWRITHVASAGDFPRRWLVVGAGGAVAAVLGLGALLLGRRRHPREAVPLPL